MGDDMRVSIGISARHVHLCQEDFEKLFGKDGHLTKYVDLNQPTMFAANEKVSIITDSGRIDNVRIVGPIRPYTQVEISKTDSYKLKLNPPVRNSGDLENSESVYIEYNGKRIFAKNSCIIANRHIHIKNSDLDKYGFKNNQIVKLKVSSIKGGILDNVVIKATEEAYFEAHLDLDDANANFINDGDIGDIIIE